MSSGAGIDAATFEQLKATLYKASGGGARPRARAVAKTTKKRSVRRGGAEGEGENGVGYNGEEDAADGSCPSPDVLKAFLAELVGIDVAQFDAFMTYLKTNNNNLYTAINSEQVTEPSDEQIAELVAAGEAFNELPPPSAGGRRKKYRGGGVWKWACNLFKLARAPPEAREEGAEAPQSRVRRAYNAATAFLTKNDPQLSQDVVNKAFSELTKDENDNVASAEVAALNEELNGLNDAAKGDKNALIAKIQVIIKKMSELLTTLTPPPRTAGGARRRTTKHRGGALDMNKLYNVQGLIGNSFSKDPMQRAGTVIDDRTPLPFSAGTSGAINQSFISDLNPVLGQMGGARKRVADGRRRKAQRGGAPPLSEDQATKLIEGFLTFYDSYSGGANFAADLEYIHYTTLRFIYIIVMNAFHDLHKIKPISVLRKVTVAIDPKIVEDYVPVTVATLETNTKITETPPPIPTNLTDMFLNIKSVDKVANIASPDFFNVWNYLGNKEGAIDIGWLKVLLEKLIEYLDDEVFIKQLNNYYNIQILKAYNDYSAGECYANCQAIYNACQKYLPFAKALLEQIDILIYKGFYITSYNMTGMKEVISYARAENAVKQISDIRKTGVIKATNTYTKPPPAGAAGGGRKKRA